MRCCKTRVPSFEKLNLMTPRRATQHTPPESLISLHQKPRSLFAMLVLPSRSLQKNQQNAGPRITLLSCYITFFSNRLELSLTRHNMHQASYLPCLPMYGAIPHASPKECAAPSDNKGTTTPPTLLLQQRDSATLQTTHIHASETHSRHYTLRHTFRSP